MSKSTVEKKNPYLYIARRISIPRKTYKEMEENKFHNIGHNCAFNKITRQFKNKLQAKKKQKQLDNCVLRTQPTRVCTALQVA